MGFMRVEGPSDKLTREGISPHLIDLERSAFFLPGCHACLFGADCPEQTSGPAHGRTI